MELNTDRPKTLETEYTPDNQPDIVLEFSRKTSVEWKIDKLEDLRGIKLSVDNKDYDIKDCRYKIKSSTGLKELTLILASYPKRRRRKSTVQWQVKNLDELEKVKLSISDKDYVIKCYECDAHLSSGIKKILLSLELYIPYALVISPPQQATL